MGAWDEAFRERILLARGLFIFAGGELDGSGVYRVSWLFRDYLRSCFWEVFFVRSGIIRSVLYYLEVFDYDLDHVVAGCLMFWGSGRRSPQLSYTLRSGRSWLF